jgi:hypothetical protein
MNSVTSDLKWYNLDNAWASNYIREAEKIFVDQQVIEKGCVFFLFCRDRVTLKMSHMQDD